MLIASSAEACRRQNQHNGADSYMLNVYPRFNFTVATKTVAHKFKFVSL